MSMIPTDRPVTGQDIYNVSQNFGLLTAEACYVMGLSIGGWTNQVKKGANQVIKDPTLALLARLLDQNPDDELVPKFPTANEMFEFLNSIQAVDSQTFSLMFGAEGGAAYRWRKPGQRANTNVERLMYHLRRFILAHAPADRPVVLDNWRKTVETEARARGVTDIYSAGTWTPGARRAAKRTKRAPKVAAEAAASPKKKPAAKRVAKKAAA